MCGYCAEELIVAGYVWINMCFELCYCFICLWWWWDVAEVCMVAVVTGGEVKVNQIVVGADDASALWSDVIVLDVGVYEKGTKVVRMYKTLLGSQGFRKGTDLYFERHDGQAVTCEDFFVAMRDANHAYFANFLLWYSRAGTPIVKPVKEPMFIPVAAGLLDSSDKDMPLSSNKH
ncbi:putative cytosol alanyl aminopeptidase [Helianthus anomalus]